MTVYLTDLGLVNALGDSKQTIAPALFSGAKGLAKCDWIPGATTYTAPVLSALPSLPPALARYQSRNAQLAQAALLQLHDTLNVVRQRYQPGRIAVVAGTSTSGIAEGERAVAAQVEQGAVPADYQYAAQEIGNLGPLVAQLTGARGVAYTLSTACSSSAHALASAQRLLDSDMADAVIAGGADSLCRLTVNGFAALDSVSDAPCVPFSRNRCGINIGEAAAFFVVTREPLVHDIELMGAGASSDAHHISAPDPAGTGAELAIKRALQQAQLNPSSVNYVNLHGTGTPLNDAMEAGVIDRLFPHRPLCSSSKGQLGHTLGAAGANEAALMWLALNEGDGKLPPHCYDGEYDPEIAALNLVEVGQRLDTSGARVYLSNSFAFGGNNAAIIVGRRDGY
ncbi:beta-ketoacyl-ACP synthase [Gilvimarinus xylanilyticus]|uniref:Beta-ketoacyl-ACP synthase n=1 Tax=Gilvimarinus xylanilyticus TaxID=2944139 RepID=A0A9X2HXB5_9GAMM|nr:beta-ketoacyl-ACP synthase [Gilvimarinus xylanilyticus]MCP8900123.1 beta-ketoacyl-ACP synthase [Gilvimarinus xylanilyticus]